MVGKISQQESKITQFSNENPIISAKSDEGRIFQPITSENSDERTLLIESIYSEKLSYIGLSEKDAATTTNVLMLEDSTANTDKVYKNYSLPTQEEIDDININELKHKIISNLPKYHAIQKDISGKYNSVEISHDHPDFPSLNEQGLILTEVGRELVVPDNIPDNVNLDQFKHLKIRFMDFRKYQAFVEDSRKYMIEKEKAEAKVKADREREDNRREMGREVLTEITPRGPPIRFTAKLITALREHLSPEQEAFLKTVIIEFILKYIREAREQAADRRARDNKNKIVDSEVSRQERRLENTKAEISSVEKKRVNRQLDVVKGMTNQRAIRYESKNVALRHEIEVGEETAGAQHIGPKVEHSVWDKKSVSHLIPSENPKVPLYKRVQYPVRNEALLAVI